MGLTALKKLSLISVITIFCIFLAYTSKTTPAIEYGRFSSLRWEDKKAQTEQRESLWNRVEFDYIWAEVSAYTSSVEECDSDPFTTAFMTKVFDGGIACPTRAWKDRLVRVYDRVYFCNDVMGPRYYGKMNFDIWMGTKVEAYAFGRRYIKIGVEKKSTAKSL